MERVKYPIYSKFSFKVFIFNLILFISIAAPLWVTSKGNYKNIMDRSKTQNALFRSLLVYVSNISINEMEAVIMKFPVVMENQRILILDRNKNILFDSGIMGDFKYNSSYDTIFPHPYISGYNVGSKPADLIRVLNKLKKKRHFEILNVRTSSGMDRVIVSSGVIELGSNEIEIILSSSVVDILLQNRSIKERFLLIYLFVILFAMLLTIILSLFVTIPFNRLVKYSRSISENGEESIKFRKYLFKGEIGDICLTLHDLFIRQKRLADNFKGFTSDVIHELKTPLAAIRSGLELYTESDDPEEKKNLYGRIARRIKHMELLMDDIHQLGVLESAPKGNVKISGDEVMLVIQDIILEYSTFGVELKHEVDMSKINIPLTGKNLWQILNNLLSNAVSFSPKRGSVSLRIYMEQERACFEVRDHGPGILLDCKEKLTERFYTYRPVGEEKHSGLGLAIVKAIVESVSGLLDLDNAPGGGAVITANIPLNKI